ncbi:LysR family transcriptional regulator [Seohaeicola saemankumensis]|nr:LysR family transcriptional regulator [Seohaeicola saemankumensis]MCA0870673.1 LysR family transcriptional regulator [Seohaeicola saemankumensis]
MDLARRLKPTHLRLIVGIVQHGKLQLAADELAMSQPAASRILSEIEAQIGAALFIRHPRWMEPTAVGEAFAKRARVILNELSSLETEVQQLNAGHSGSVRVGSVTGPGVGVLVPAIRAVKESAPEISVTVEIGPSTQLIRGLTEDHFDFVLARLPPEYDSGEFRVFPARTETVSFIVRGDHPLAGRRGVTLADLSGFEWVMQERGSPIRQAVEAEYLNSGLPVPRQITNSSSLLIMLALLARSDIVAPLSQEVAGVLTEGIHADLVTVDLDRDIVVEPYFIIADRAQRLSRAAERVLEEVLMRLGRIRPVMEGADAG